jgi:hypothetical protein
MPHSCAPDQRPVNTLQHKLTRLLATRPQHLRRLRSLTAETWDRLMGDPPALWQDRKLTSITLALGAGLGLSNSLSRLSTIDVLCIVICDEQSKTAGIYPA